MRARGGGGDERAQTATIGIVLVFGIMLMGASVVVVFGVGAIEDSQQTLSVERAEKALTQLDSKAALVALGNTDSQTVNFARSGDDQFTVENGTGWMNVTIENTTSGFKDTDFVNQSLGSVVYENADEEIAYQGGGVWRSSREGESVMVSPPEFHFRNGTLTLPVLNLTGDASLGGGAAISHTETIKEFPQRGVTNRVNPLDQHRVNLVVQSDHYQAWGSYFEERTDGNVDYDHSKNKVVLDLVSPIGKRRITAASASLAASGTFTFQGNADSDCPFDGDSHVYPNKDVVTNSYDSSTGPYCNQAAAGNLGVEGDIVYGGDVDISSGGKHPFHGDIISGGAVDVAGGGSGKPWVFGNINFTDTPDTKSQLENRIVAASGGEATQISGIRTATPINFLIKNKIEDVESNNDNGDAGVPISSNELQYTSGQVTLEDGTYLLDHIRPNTGDSIELQTNGEKIILAVRGNIDLADSASIEVIGDGTVEVYVGGQSGHMGGATKEFTMGKEAKIFNIEDNGTRFRLYGKDDLDARIGVSGAGSTPTKYQGVIYAPPGAAGTGTVEIQKGEVFGGLLTGTTEIPTNGDAVIHYDEALRNKQIISRSAKVVKVTYLHVTINRIHVANG